MSIENVKRFYDTIATDTDLRQRIIEANKKYAGQTLDNHELEKLMAEEFLPLLKEEGYYFTIDELITYQNEIIKSDNSLAQSSFENISGGVTPKKAIRNLLKDIFKL